MMNDTTDSLRAVDLHPICSVCGETVWGGTKRHPATKCLTHFGCICAACGHEAFWLTTRKHPAGRWVCFSLQCDWVSTEYTKPFHQPNTKPSHQRGGDDVAS